MPQERRLATVLFADIVGSSGVTGAHDPEVVRHTLAAAFAAMRRILVDHGGTVEKFIGDAVMAVFGVPVAHEDDAARAVRAALALRKAIRSAENGDELQLRIGINTGEVVAGDEEQAETLVTGTPVIVASRLQTAALPDEILAGELTRRLTEDRFEYAPARRVAAKNMGEIAASAVVGGARRPAGGLFVGRSAELARLRAIREAAMRSGRAARVMVIGPAGIGKTRIGQELEKDGVAAWGHCAAYGEADALAPLQEIVRSLVAVSDPDTVGPSASRVTALLSGRPWAPDISADEAQREIADALARFLDAGARACTTLLIEDLHAAEPAFLEILDAVRSRVTAPVLLVGLARPEILERAWAWVAGGESLLLGPLETTETEELARKLLGDRASPPLLSAIVGRAAGIPLYVEQVARTVLEGGDPQDIPPTLRGLIAARLDRAGADTRRLLQRGSVLGRDFWLDAVPWDPGPSIAECAADAEARGLIGVLDTPGPSGEPTVRFSHALIRDVAYASTTKVDRVRLHMHYADWLGSTGAERAAEAAEAIAFHAEQAFSYATEIEHPDSRRLGAAAFDALMTATWAARGRADFRTALALSARALDVGRRAAIAPKRLADALGHQAMTRLRLEPGAEALQLLDRAIDAAREVQLGEHLVRLLGWRAGIEMATDVERARQLLAESVDVARATGDNELITYSLSRSGMIGETTGALDEQARALNEARDLALRTGARGWLADTVAELSGNALSQGDVAAARAYALEATRAAAEGSPLQRFKAALATSLAELAEGRDDDALADAMAAFELGREIGGPWALAVSSEALAEAQVARGAFGEAREVLAHAARLDPEATPAMRPFVARIRAALARTLVRLGDADAARSAASGALAAAPRTDVRAVASAHWAAAEVDALAGSDAGAREHFTAALDTIERTGYRMLAARIRSAYATHLAEHAPAPKA